MKNKNNSMWVFCICVVIALAYTAFYNWMISINEQELNTANAILQSTQEELASVVENLQLESIKSEKLATELDSVTKSLDEANKTILALKTTEYELVYIGNFELTHYCTEIYEHICGTGTGVTATGTQVAAGRTIAVDPKIVPYGSQVYIEGYGWRVAEDTGGAIKGKRIDVAVETHEMALGMGVKNRGVWVLVQKKG